MKYYNIAVDTVSLPYKELTLFYKHLKVINRDVNPVKVYLQSELVAVILGNEQQTFLDFNSEPKKDMYYNLDRDTYSQGKIIKIEATNLNQNVEVYNYGI